MDFHITFWNSKALPPEHSLLQCVTVEFAPLTRVSTPSAFFRNEKQKPSNGANTNMAIRTPDHRHQIQAKAIASRNHDQHLSTNSQFIRCQNESYVIVHHCSSLSCLYCLFHCIPMTKIFFPNRNSFRQGKAASLGQVWNIA